jgi:hypothetical protein
LKRKLKRLPKNSIKQKPQRYIGPKYIKKLSEKLKELQESKEKSDEKNKECQAQ